MNKLDLKNVYNIQSPPISECPYCNCNIFYKNVRAGGRTQLYFNAKGKIDNNFYKNIVLFSIGKFVYCANCHRKLFKYRP